MSCCVVVCCLVLCCVVLFRYRGAAPIHHVLLNGENTTVCCVLCCVVLCFPPHPVERDSLRCVVLCFVALCCTSSSLIVNNREKKLCFSCC